MVSMNHFDSSRNNVIFFFKWKPVIEKHVIKNPLTSDKDSLFEDKSGL